MRRREVKETPVVSDLINQAQVAELAGVHRNTMARLLRSDPDAPQPQRHVGKIQKWSRQEVTAWIRHGALWKVIEGEKKDQPRLASVSRQGGA